MKISITVNTRTDINTILKVILIDIDIGVVHIICSYGGTVISLRAKRGSPSAAAGHLQP